MGQQSASERQTLQTSTRSNTMLLLTIAGAVALVHVLTNGRYGLHRDELQTLTDALHMD